MAFPVKWLHSNMQGAPQITNANGDLTSMLDAVLANGFNLRAVASLTRAGATATVTIAAGHKYEAGQIVRVSGADQGAYNGDQRVLAVTSNTFTFEVAGTPATPATGASIQVRSAPLGFDIAYSGTNKRAYRSPNLDSNRPYLRVDDSLDPAYNASYAKKGKVTLAQGMSDIDTVVGKQAPYDAAQPTKNHVASGSGTTVIDGWFKWYYARNCGLGSYSESESSGAPSGAKRWLVVGDDRGFYLFVEWAAGLGLVMYSFTDFISYRVGDAYNSLLVASDAAVAANNASTYINVGGTMADVLTYSTRTASPTGKVALASHLQVGPPKAMYFTSLATNPASTTTISGYSVGVPWPNGPDYGLLLHPVYLQEDQTNHLRGRMPGMLWVHNVNPSLQHLDIIDGVAGYAGRRFLIAAAAAYGDTVPMNSARIAFDITGPWW